jgi:short-subunit dehydrogenase
VESVKTQTGGTLDYLVNNAGQTIIMPTLDFDIETAKGMFNINIWGMMRVTQEFAPLIIAAGGTLVNVCSISTSVNTPWMGELLVKLSSTRPLLMMRKVSTPVRKQL